MDLDLRKIREMGDDASDKPAAPKLVGRELDIYVKGFVDPNTGKVHSGVLISRVLTAGELAHVDRAAARMAGVPWSFLSPLAQVRIQALAQISTQIRDPPEWFNEWAPLVEDLLFQVVSQCRAHNQRYLRAGRSEGVDSEGRSLISVSSALSTSDPDEPGDADGAGPGAG